MSFHIILACMNRAVRAVLPLDATAWKSPALCVRLEPAAMMSSEILFLYPLLLDRLLVRVLETHIESWIPGRVTAKS